MAFRHCAENSRENPGCGLAVLQKYIYILFFFQVDYHGQLISKGFGFFFSIPSEMFPFKEECL